MQFIQQQLLTLLKTKLKLQPKLKKLVKNKRSILLMQFMQNIQQSLLTNL